MRSSACVAALLGVMAGVAQAAEPAKPAAVKPAPTQSKPAKVEPVDAELLEFLGSLDTEEQEWREYLEDRPIKAAGKPAEPKTPPPSEPAPKQSQQVKKP